MEILASFPTVRSPGAASPPTDAVPSIPTTGPRRKRTAGLRVGLSSRSVIVLTGAAAILWGIVWWSERVADTGRGTGRPGVGDAVETEPAAR
ncbi:MAG: hypothetical protein EBR28_01220 [Planctomycetia bacterium]|nr:hypothetical protein [Planctomycetia bacterium]